MITLTVVATVLGTLSGIVIGRNWPASAHRIESREIRAALGASVPTLAALPTRIEAAQQSVTPTPRSPRKYAQLSLRRRQLPAAPGGIDGGVICGVSRRSCRAIVARSWSRK